MSSPVPPQPAPYGAPPRKKVPVWVWILSGLGLFVLLLVLLAVAAGLFVLHKVKESGVDQALLQKNPALAMTKMITAFNPNAEVLHFDEERGIITVRDKQSGKTFTLNFEDVKRGRIVFMEEGKGEVTLETREGKEGGSFEVRSEEGTAKFGAGSPSDIPLWVPLYPGVKPQVHFAIEGKKGESGSFHFNTSDAPDKVAEFFEQELAKKGIPIKSSAHGAGEGGGGRVLTAEDGATGRHVVVAITSGGSGSSVNVTFNSRD